jgi:hypothetical protein
MKKIFLLSALSFLFVLTGFKSHASHYMGGEITWECKSNGKFVFTLIYYRECNGITFPTTQNLFSNSPLSTIPMTLEPGYPKDITPQCNPDTSFTHISCNNVTASNMGAMSVYKYTSGEVVLAGVPPATGWTFYSNSCCRNPSTNIVGQKGWRLRSTMYPHNNQNTYPCFDNSPEFAEYPQSVISIGYPVIMNQYAEDLDLDSLLFEFGQPLDNDTTPLGPYAPGYSYQSPTPDSSANPNNQPSLMNPSNGAISLTSYTPGAFLTCIRVASFRNGNLISEVFREFQFVFSSNVGGNLPPVVTAPFPNNIDPFVDTVMIGDTVNFGLSATDFQLLPNGLPQTMFIEVFGNQLGDFVAPVGSSMPTLSSSQGCLNPPCATLTPAPGPNYPLSAQFGVQTQFNWLIDCSHMIAQNGVNEYNFIVKVKDDHCPIPALAYSNFKLVVLGKPFNNPPSLLSYGYIPSIQKVILQWSNQPVDSSNFIAYNIYEASSANGPFVLIDSVMDYTITLYDLANSNVLNQNSYYQIRTKYNHDCNGVVETAASQTLSILISDIEDLGTDNLQIGNAYPNPTNQNSMVKITSPTNQQAIIKVMNLGGKLLMNENVNLVAGEQDYNFDMSRYPAGTYFYQIEVDKGVYSGMIIVQK